MRDYQVDTSGARAQIEAVVERAANTEKALRVIGRQAVSEVKLNFIEGGRVPENWVEQSGLFSLAPGGGYVEPGKWKPLSPRTLLMRRKSARGAKILIDTGVLMSSITFKIEGDALLVGTIVKYGKYHQHGTNRIPPRPFITFLPDTMREFRSTAKRFLVTGEVA